MDMISRPTSVGFVSRSEKEYSYGYRGARGKQEVQRSATMIRAFHATCPHVQLWFSHDEDHL